MKIRKNDDLLGLPSIRVIGASGETLGIMTLAEGLRLAREQGLDLVEVNPRAQPPVCKLLDFSKYTYAAAREAPLRRRGPGPLVFLVRSKLVIRGRPGAFLVGDIVTGDAIRAGMMAHIPVAPDRFNAIPIRTVDFVDHRAADKTSELALHVVGDTSEQTAAIEALEGAHLIEITERPAT